MMMRPYMERREWFCVTSHVHNFKQFPHRHRLIGLQGRTGISGKYWAPMPPPSIQSPFTASSHLGGTDDSNSTEPLKTMAQAPNFKSEIGTSDSGSSPRQRYPKTETEILANTDPIRYVHMFLCQSRLLFDTVVKVKDNYNDEDQKVFQNLRTSYQASRGLLRRWSLVTRLIGIRIVKVIIL